MDRIFPSYHWAWCCLFLVIFVNLIYLAGKRTKTALGVKSSTISNSAGKHTHKTQVLQSRACHSRLSSNRMGRFFFRRLLPSWSWRWLWRWPKFMGVWCMEKRYRWHSTATKWGKCKFVTSCSFCLSDFSVGTAQYICSAFVLRMSLEIQIELAPHF